MLNVIVLLFVGLVFLGVLFSGYLMEPAVLTSLGIFLVVVIPMMIFNLTQKTIVSEDEISSQNIFGLKTLRWSEINRVSGRGNAIKLHNTDGDVTVSLSPRLPGYEEVVEVIGKKRPDLFNPQEYSVMTRGLGGLLSTILAVIFLCGSMFVLGNIIYESSASITEVIVPLLIVGVMILVGFGMTLSKPTSLTLEGSSLKIKYLFGQKNLSVGEIQNVTFAYQQTRNGKIYFIALFLGERKSVRISGIGPSLPIVYLVLKNWQRQSR
jgi:hypothetical protein